LIRPVRQHDIPGDQAPGAAERGAKFGATTQYVIIAVGIPILSAVEVM